MDLNSECSQRWSSSSQGKFWPSSCFWGSMSSAHAPAHSHPLQYPATLPCLLSRRLARPWSEQPFAATPSSADLPLLSGVSAGACPQTLASDIQCPKPFTACFDTMKEGFWGKGVALSQRTDLVRPKSKREGELRRMFYQNKDTV